MKKPPAALTPRLLGTAVDLIGTIPIRAGDTSMLPILRPGQAVAVERFPGAEAAWPLRRGDLLLFRQADYLVVHRLLKRARPVDGRPALRTRGDGSPELDPALDPRHIVGRVTAIRGADGWWDLRPGGARFYATCVALHDLFWAAVCIGARAGDRMLGRLRLPALLWSPARSLDRGLLRIAHRIFFRLFHRRIKPRRAREASREGGDRGAPD